jgi:hypothetical protein
VRCLSPLCLEPKLDSTSVTGTHDACCLLPRMPSRVATSLSLPPPISPLSGHMNHVVLSQRCAPFTWAVFSPCRSTHIVRDRATLGMTNQQHNTLTDLHIRRPHQPSCSHCHRHSASACRTAHESTCVCRSLRKRARFIRCATVWWRVLRGLTTADCLWTTSSRFMSHVVHRRRQHAHVTQRHPAPFVAPSSGRSKSWTLRVRPKGTDMQPCRRYARSRMSTPFTAVAPHWLMHGAL